MKTHYPLPIASQIKENKNKIEAAQLLLLFVGSCLTLSDKLCIGIIIGATALYLEKICVVMLKKVEAEESNFHTKQDIKTFRSHVAEHYSLITKLTDPIDRVCLNFFKQTQPNEDLKTKALNIGQYFYKNLKES